MSKSDRVLGVIPARFESSRLPGKPLKDIAGKSLIQRVYEQAIRSKLLSEVVVSTDDERIQKHAESFGARVIITGSHHLTGSDRVSETALILDKNTNSFAFVANIQGDMPFINPEAVDLTIKTLMEAPSDFGMSTIATPIIDETEFERPASVKVVVGHDGLALYFSRAPIPFWRERNPSSVTPENPFGHKHVGLYVFRPDVLHRLSSLPQSLPETREKLEQLRALSNGVKIRVAIAPKSIMHPSIEVDTPDDLERACKAALI